MKQLKYTIKRTRERGQVTFFTKPNQWATEARATLITKPTSCFPLEETLPRIEHVGWSAGARKWTVPDARIFFKAALEMLDAVEAAYELSPQSGKESKCP